MLIRHLFVIACSLTTLLFPQALRGENNTGGKAKIDWGHSHLGEEYDEGPRAKPWIMDGIGKTHFPITTSHPEVQKWFDQANTLLHGFWRFEAERNFRWCLKLDPECAMAYWGMSRIARGKRAEKFLAEASKRKDKVTDRERRYIELSESLQQLKAAEDDSEKQRLRKEFVLQFDRLLVAYPDDREARLWYWLEVPNAVREEAREGFNPYRAGLEYMLQSVLREDPDHVGALHYRIHNWDGTEGEFALNSCQRLSFVAPNCGHLQHMPGHVLSGVGLWHEAAIAMDSATRVEKEYMQRRMVLPENNWNYRHNLDYLCYIQEQLGMHKAARLGAEQLIKAPLRGGDGPLLRLQVKFERWDEILAKRAKKSPPVPFADYAYEHARIRALIGKNRLKEAQAAYDSLAAKIENPTAANSEKNSAPRRKRAGESPSKAPPSKPSGAPQKQANPTPARSIPPRIREMMKKRQKAVLVELEARLAIANGRRLEGIQKLIEAAEAQEQSWSNDPPKHPQFLFNAVGDAFLDLGSHQLAIDAYKRTLKTVKNDGFALSGLVYAHHKLGETAKAKEALAALKVVWSDADADNRWLQRALSTNLEVEPHLDAPLQERNYKQILATRGPSLWKPNASSALKR